MPVYFDKKQGKANAITSTGASIGALVLAPLMTFFFDTYGYTGTILIPGGLLLHIIVTALLFRHPKTAVINMGKIGDKYEGKDQESQEQYDEPDILNIIMEVQKRRESKKLENEKPPVRTSNLEVYIHILTDPIFVAFAISVMCFIFMLSCNAFLAGFAEERDISNTLTAIILVVTSVATCLGQILFGIVFYITCFKKKKNDFILFY